METLFLTVVLGLVAALQAQDPLSFTSEEQDRRVWAAPEEDACLGLFHVTGTWYVKAIVTDRELPEGKRPSKVSPVTVTALEGGDLETTFTIMKAGQCHQKKVLMQKTEEPGKYSTYGGKKLMYLQELPVKDHDIWYCEFHHHGKPLRIGKLMAATVAAPPEPALLQDTEPHPRLDQPLPQQQPLLPPPRLTPNKELQQQPWTRPVCKGDLGVGSLEV
ncbi:PREDICTED: odorant-binding protein 2b-like [Galeopterus variegatus]|uniref:Odorant-binding protein 2b-like n=1 Tax=Galeopterus variegatus TaxID=482537 RepID=A0ABM0PYT4_GALVR|nr:PREDICTED: odorant-binding protein 2b-like [Galeopterus variegatus]